MQYFMMAAFCWMLIEGIYLYFFVVKVYNINTKMYMYHVISWGEFCILKHALVTVTILSDRQIWCCHHRTKLQEFVNGNVAETC